MKLKSLAALCVVFLAYGYVIGPNYPMTVNVAVGLTLGFVWGLVWPLVERKK